MPFRISRENFDLSLKNNVTPRYYADLIGRLHDTVIYVKMTLQDHMEGSFITLHIINQQTMKQC